MHVRTVLVVAALAAALASPASFAQGQGRRGGAARVGPIKSVDATAKSFVMTTRRMNQETDITIKTDAETRIMKGVEAGAFTDVKVGGFAVVLGQGMPDTGITGRQVFLFEKAAAASTGTVKSVDPATKTVVITTGGQQGRDVTVKASDKTKVHAGQAAGKWEDIAVGKRVIAIGEGSAQAGITAIHIVVLPGAAGAQ